MPRLTEVKVPLGHSGAGLEAAILKRLSIRAQELVTTGRRCTGSGAAQGAASARR